MTYCLWVDWTLILRSRPNKQPWYGAHCSEQKKWARYKHPTSSVWNPARIWHGFYFPYGFTFLLQCSHAVNLDNGVKREGALCPHEALNSLWKWVWLYSLLTERQQIVMHQCQANGKNREETIRKQSLHLHTWIQDLFYLHPSFYFKGRNNTKQTIK